MHVPPLTLARIGVLSTSPCAPRTVMFCRWRNALDGMSDGRFTPLNVVSSSVDGCLTAFGAFAVFWESGKSLRQTDHTSIQTSLFWKPCALGSCAFWSDPNRLSIWCSLLRTCGICWMTILSLKSCQTNRSRDVKCNFDKTARHASKFQNFKLLVKNPTRN